MAYTPEMGIEFWFEFDNVFLPGPQMDPEVRQAYVRLNFDFDLPDRSRRRHRRNGTYPAGFRADMTPFAAPLGVLADKQIAVIRKHFEEDTEAVRLVFEDFGQGVLFDDRREPGRKLHTMDSSGPADPPIGYHRWHAFIRAFVAVGADQEAWLALNRNVGLAWAIQSILQPAQDQPDNPRLPEERLAALREEWLTRSEEELDNAFDRFPFPEGLP